MSAKASPQQRLDALVDAALRDAEKRTDAGKPLSARELNGLRRLVANAEAERRVTEQLERANALTRG